MRNLTELKNMDKDDLLGLLGLETRRAPIEQWLGFLAGGLLVGAGVALLLAPSSGRQLREELKSRIKQVPDLLPAEPPASNGERTRS
jgi:hypothetical protein